MLRGQAGGSHSHSQTLTLSPTTSSSASNSRATSSTARNTVAIGARGLLGGSIMDRPADRRDDDGSQQEDGSFLRFFRGVSILRLPSRQGVNSALLTFGDTGLEDEYTQYLLKGDIPIHKFRFVFSALLVAEAVRFTLSRILGVSIDSLQAGLFTLTFIVLLLSSTHHRVQRLIKRLGPLMGFACQLFILFMATIRYMTEGTIYTIILLSIPPIVMHIFALPFLSIVFFGYCSTLGLWFLRESPIPPVEFYVFGILEILALYASEWNSRRQFLIHHQLEADHKEKEELLARTSGQLESVQTQLHSSRQHNKELLKTHKNSLDVKSRMSDAYRYLNMPYTDSMTASSSLLRYSRVQYMETLQRCTKSCSRCFLTKRDVLHAHEWVEHEKDEVVALYRDVSSNDVLFQPSVLMEITRVFETWCAERNIELIVNMDSSAQSLMMCGDMVRIKLAAQLLIWVALQQARKGAGDRRYPVYKYNAEKGDEVEDEKTGSRSDAGSHAGASSSGDLLDDDDEDAELSAYDGRVVVTITNTGVAGVAAVTLVEPMSSSSSAHSHGLSDDTKHDSDRDSHLGGVNQPLLGVNPRTRQSSTFSSLVPPDQKRREESQAEAKTVLADVFWLRIEIEHTGPEVASDVVAKAPSKNSHVLDKDGKLLNRKDMERKPLHLIEDDLSFCQAVEIKLASRLSKFSRGRITYTPRERRPELRKPQRMPEFRLGVMVKSIKGSDVAVRSPQESFKFLTGLPNMKP